MISRKKLKTISSSDIVASSQQSTYYDAIADSYNELHGNEQKKKLHLILPFLDSDSILDVGCGTGVASLPAAVGIDPSKNLLQKNTTNKKKYCGVAEDLPFPNQSFDIILCLTGIHHCNLKQALAEFRRVARKKIIISVLKRITQHKKIVQTIRKELNIIKEIDEEKDVILVCAV